MHINVVEFATMMNGYGCGFLLFNASHLHAPVSSLTKYYYAFVPDVLADDFTDVGSKPFLYLQSSCLALNDTCQLAQSHNLSVRNVSNGNGAEKREYVVLAQGVELYVLDNYHVVTIVCEQCLLD